jgi:hypothetical protein
LIHHPPATLYTITTTHNAIMVCWNSLDKHMPHIFEEINTLQP